MKQQKQKLHIYTGDGKGKTTAALGLLLRAYGQGEKILYCQFFKDGSSGELVTLSQLDDRVTVLGGFPLRGFLQDMDEIGRTHAVARQTELWQAALEEMNTGKYDLIILDEVLLLIDFGILTEEEILAAAQARPDNAELVLTGRGVCPKLLDAADYLSEIVKRKHPFDQGLGPRRGVEY